MFAYNPMEDKLLPCPEVGLSFEYGDVLKVRTGAAYRATVSVVVPVSENGCPISVRLRSVIAMSVACS